MLSITVGEILDLGVARETISRNLSAGKWKHVGKRPGRHPDDSCKILLSSLPSDIQLKWLQNSVETYRLQEKNALHAVEASSDDKNIEETGRLLSRFPLIERQAWIEEVCRLTHIIEHYNTIKPKRELDPYTHKYVYVSEVLKLCDEAKSTSQIILAREPHRAVPPSPHTLQRWSSNHRNQGVLAFLRNVPEQPPNADDKRRAVISIDAARWINSNWRRYKGAKHLYNAIEKEAEINGWVIPSESWFYRVWEQIPEVIKTYLFDGAAAYISKYAPFVPRDFSDLEALQLLCGDHSERDVTVVLKDGSTKRPWITLWLDLRTWLIWGWYLDLVPSSQSVALAYADGVQNFGAQPMSRPEQEFYSYLYTDHGRTYKSHRWDGKEIAVHESAMDFTGGMKLLLHQRKVGIITTLLLKHLLARRWNAREKPVERIFRDMSEWEQNTFDAYCGSTPSKRPDRARVLYTQHQQFLAGKRKSSPYPTFEQYREELTEFIIRHNHSEHARTTLGGEVIVPIEEFKRLYTTHYKISSKTLSLLLMRPEKRVIEKDGVNCFRRNWYYFNEAMSKFKGSSVEVLLLDNNYRSVQVILPNNALCEAKLITPTSILNPNKATLQAVKEAQAHERKLIRDYQLLNESLMRGETTEARVMRQMKDSESEDGPIIPDPQAPSGEVHQLTRFDHTRITVIPSPKEVSAQEISECETDETMFDSCEPPQIKGINYEES